MDTPTPTQTMGESHRARAQRFARDARDEGQMGFAIVHALLAIEEQVQSVAYLLGHGADTRRLDCEDPSKVAEKQ